MSEPTKRDVRFAHVSLVARDWRQLAAFYASAFGYETVPPERQLSGAWIERATGIAGAMIEGVHLRLPDDGPGGPTVEIFSYTPDEARQQRTIRTPGLAHFALAVDDVRSAAAGVFRCGGSPVGEQIQRHIPETGTIDFQYVADPEGNIIELQRWETE